MKNIGLKLAGAFLATVLTSVSYAAGISGRIDIGAFNSKVDINFTNDTVTFIEDVPGTVRNAQVTSASGDYAVFAPTGGAPTLVTYTDFDYSLPYVNLTVNQRLWEINSSTYFILNNITAVNENSIQTSLGLTGLGMAYLGTTLTATPGQWSFSADKVTGQSLFTFSSTTQVPPPAVPDGGSSLALLGAAISALGLIARSRRLS